MLSAQDILFTIFLSVVLLYVLATLGDHYQTSLGRVKCRKYMNV